jgi:hypothetical protein
MVAAETCFDKYFPARYRAISTVKVILILIAMRNMGRGLEPYYLGAVIG